MEATLDTTEVRTWKRYDDFERTRVDWIDKHPSDWLGIPVKRWVVTPVTDGPHETPRIDTEGIDFVSAESMKDGKIDFDYRRGYISRELHEVYCRKLRPQRDDIFMCKSGATTGKIAMVDTDREFNVWSPLALIRVDLERMYPRYMFWALQSDYVQNQVRRTWSEGTQPNISMASIERLFIAAPRIVGEQRAIAAFLDRETARIDALIGHKERLIALLEEKRQAVISHAVTRGLDPNAKMKDSGVDWIGQLPVHWKVLKGRWLGDLVPSRGYTELEQADEQDTLSFFKVDDLNTGLGQLNLGESKGHAIPDSRVTDSGEVILFPKRGAAIFTNKVRIVNDPVLFDPNLMAWSINPKHDVRFVAYALLSRGLSDLADVSSVPQINNKHVYPAQFPAPPKDEQTEIVEYIERMRTGIAKLLGEIHESIELLKEYRTALISAAVTGQIDVREEVSA